MPLLDWIAVHWVAALALMLYLAVLMYNALLGRRAQHSILSPHSSHWAENCCIHRVV